MGMQRALAAGRSLSTRHRRCGLVSAVVVGVVVSLLAGACSNDGDGGSDGANVIKIGADLDLSGPRQATEKSQADGMRAAVNDINDAGGVTVDGETYTFEFDPSDHRGDPTRVVSIARELVEEEVLATLYPSLRFDAFYEIVKDEMIVIAAAFPAEGLLFEDIEAHPQLILQIPLLRDFYAGMFLQIRELSPDIERVALLNVDSENGRPEAEGIAAAAEAQGLTVVDSIFYPEDTQDFTPFLTRLAGESVDLLIGPINPADSIPLLVQAAQLGVARLGLTQALVPEDLGDLGAFADLPLIMAHFSVTFDRYNFDDIRDAGADLVSSAGDQPIVPEIAVDVYNTTWLLAMAIEQAGTIEDREAIVAAMKDVVYDGPFGPVALSDSQAVVGHGMAHVVRDGQVTVYEYESVESPAPLREESFPIEG